MMGRFRNRDRVDEVQFLLLLRLEGFGNAGWRSDNYQGAECIGIVQRILQDDRSPHAQAHQHRVDQPSVLYHGAQIGGHVPDWRS